MHVSRKTGTTQGEVTQGLSEVQRQKLLVVFVNWPGPGCPQRQKNDERSKETIKVAAARVTANVYYMLMMG